MSNDIQPHQRLKMPYAGADWLVKQLDSAERHSLSVRVGKRSVKVKAQISPIGMTVADVLGFAWEGLYHINNEAILRVDWSDTRCIAVGIPGDLASVDGRRLTVLVVLCHDLGLRLEVSPHGPRGLLLRFHQRSCRLGGLGERCPTMERHIELIRAGYSVADCADVSEDAGGGS